MWHSRWMLLVWMCPWHLNYIIYKITQYELAWRHAARPLKEKQNAVISINVRAVTERTEILRSTLTAYEEPSAERFSDFPFSTLWGALSRIRNFGCVLCSESHKKRKWQCPISSKLLAKASRQASRVGARFTHESSSPPQCNTECLGYLQVKLQAI